MLSNVFKRLLTSVRPLPNYQQQFLRLLATSEPLTADNAATNNERQTGIVKRFSKEKGYGFISKNSDGTDCFVHFKNINTTGFKTLEQGQEVEFSIAQGTKGAEARDVSILNAGTSGSTEMGDSSGNDSTSSRYSFGGSARRRPSSSSSSAFRFGGGDNTSDLFSEGQDSSSTERSFNFSTGSRGSSSDNLFSSRRSQSDSDQKRQIGSVKRWTGDRGFGFIRRANGGPDLFCHVRSLRDGVRELEEGQTVQYTIQKTEKGEEARNVTVVNDENFSAEEQDASSTTDSGERQTGSVKRWIAEKGYGFLQRTGGGSSVFAHLRDLPDGVTSLEEGQTVEFDLVNSEKGDLAKNITVRNES